jgi:hypothetical protein
MARKCSGLTDPSLTDEGRSRALTLRPAAAGVLAPLALAGCAAPGPVVAPLKYAPPEPVESPPTDPVGAPVGGETSSHRSRAATRPPTVPQ